MAIRDRLLAGPVVQFEAIVDTERLLTAFP
jgi:hypothetical protein